jgi:transcriptional regulator with XRE-family HTH domain
MTLEEYIQTHRVTEGAIAAKAKCTQGTVNRVRHGMGNPTFDLLRRISEATGGKFTPGEFEPKKRAAE